MGDALHDQYTQQQSVEFMLHDLAHVPLPVGRTVMKRRRRRAAQLVPRPNEWRERARGRAPAWTRGNRTITMAPGSLSFPATSVAIALLLSAVAWVFANFLAPNPCWRRGDADVEDSCARLCVCEKRWRRDPGLSW